MNNQPIITELNNGVLTSTHAMPLKDITSNNESVFSMSRRLFFRSSVVADKPDFSINQQGTTVIERESLALSNKVVIDGKKTALQKKWIGGNRDASSRLLRSKVNNTALLLANNSGPTSFKNGNDKNAVNDAITRVRSSGYRVPPSVTQRNVLPPAVAPDYYRIIANGWNYSNVTGIYSAGIYRYTPTNLAGTPIVSVGLGTTLRSYTLMTISRTTGAVQTYTPFDVFGSTVQATALANLLNSLPSTVIVIITTFDEPRTNSILLKTAMQNCGASSSFNTLINYRGAYVLVGIPGIGVDGGLERYVGVSNGSTGDPNALVDLRISVSGGNYTYISG
jgi:hypothetical protein